MGEAEPAESGADFDEFAREVTPGLLRAARILTGEWPAAEDLTQVALLKTWRRWSAMGSSEHPRAFARRVLINEHVRRRRRHWRAEIPQLLPDRPHLDADLEVAELRLALDAALSHLTPRERAVVALRYTADLTQADTAIALGCTIGTVKKLNFRALAKLREVPSLAQLGKESPR